jgi:hypothetical protein
MRQRHPTVQAVCKVHGISEFYQAMRTGTDTLVKTGCTLCKAERRATPAPAHVHPTTVTPEPDPSIAQRISYDLKRRFGTDECELDEAHALSPEPVHDPSEDRYPPGPPYFGSLKDPDAFYDHVDRLHGDERPRLTLTQERKALAAAVARREAARPFPRRTYPGL